MRNELMRTVAILSGVALAATSVVQAQGQQTPPRPEPPPVVLKVDVVLSRYQGDRKVASLPFTSWLGTASGPGGQAAQRIRVGVDVPIGSTTATTGQNRNTGPSTTPTGSTTTSETTTKVEYRYVGTAIDTRAFRASPSDPGVFSVMVDLQDSSVYTPDAADAKAGFKITDPMAFRTFSMSNTMTMRDGQTVQFGTATDKISGETIRVDVTLTVVK